MFGESEGAYDNDEEIAYGLMFHGFDYPDETGENELYARFWNPVLKKGILFFDRPEECRHKKLVRQMTAKSFGTDNVKPVCLEAEELEVTV